MVLDRLFLWIFTMAVVVGTAGIILQAPSLYDDRSPIDKELSDIGQQVKFLYIVVWPDLTPPRQLFQDGNRQNSDKERAGRTRTTCWSDPARWALWEKWARWCKHQQQLIFTPGANNGELATDGGANLVLIIQRLAPDFPKLVLTKQWMELFLVGDLASSSLPVLIQPDSCDTARQCCCSTLSWLS